MLNIAGPSCISNLVSSWNMIATDIDNQKSINVLNLDGTAAFDCLFVPKILDTLKDVGVGGRIGKFFQSWLTLRYQFVQICESTSYIARVQSGVPQGSVLGPILYILASSPGLIKAIDDTNAECTRLGIDNKVEIMTYADDIKTYFRLRDENDLIIVKELLKNLEEYSKSTGLRFNGEKSQWLRLGTNQLDCQLMLLGNIIPEVKYMKDLGVWFNKKYTFTTMINTQMAKAACVIQMIKHGLKVRDVKSLTQLYTMYFQSTLLYGSEVWANSDNALKIKLDSMDDKFWALLPNNLVKPDCLTSIQRAMKKNLSLYFKIKYNLSKTSLKTPFKFCQDSANTRGNMMRNLLPPKCRLAMKQKEFVNVTSKLYNKMDLLKRESKLLIVFEREAEKIVRRYF